jgi:hypothetical protein
MAETLAAARWPRCRRLVVPPASRCDCLAELGWIRAEAMRARDGGRPTVRFRLNPRLPAGRHDRSRRVPPEASESP